MGIRSIKNTKDHLCAAQGLALATINDITNFDHKLNELKFFTVHPTKPCLVDLTAFAHGLQELPNGRKDWNGPFSGRSELINELLPAIKDNILYLAEKSVEQYLASFRTWWRLFDNLEEKMPSLQRVSSTGHLTDIHKQYALDSGMDRKIFGTFLRLANITRVAKLNLKQLYWQAPESVEKSKYLPPSWQLDQVRHALKRQWFSTIDRWELADNLRKTNPSNNLSNDSEIDRLQQNYQHFEKIIQRTGNPRPPATEIRKDISHRIFSQRGLSVSDMLKGRYPDGDDIRIAFHLCLATTGWNPAVLLNLDFNENFIEAHPKDSSRYIMRSIKDRAGGTEQITEGLFKTQGGAGFIVKTLIERTSPLRDAAKKELKERDIELKSLIARGATTTEIDKIRKHVVSLEKTIRSVWIYVNTATTEICALTDNSFSKTLTKSNLSYLPEFIKNLNEKIPEQRQLSMFTAVDLRKAYAVYTYRASGGSVLAVMKALGHRNFNTSITYLNNTILNEEHRQLFLTFSTTMWSELEKTGRVDPTILAKFSRYGSVTIEERERLETYRTLMRSRIGTGCKDPLHPPYHIAPTFVADGKSMCHVQRCTLCLENAVILPDSLPGLCKRVAELRFLQEGMSVGAFVESSFLEELNNTEIALLAFDQNQVHQYINQWTEKISLGIHHVIGFDGSITKDIQ